MLNFVHRSLACVSPIAFLTMLTVSTRALMIEYPGLASGDPGEIVSTAMALCGIPASLVLGAVLLALPLLAIHLLLDLEHRRNVHPVYAALISGACAGELGCLANLFGIESGVVLLADLALLAGAVGGALYLAYDEDVLAY